MKSSPMSQVQRVLLRLTQYNDIILALLIVAIIVLMILPLPSLLVDGLIATNLTIAIILMMLSLYIPSALSISTFPTILLFTTLFRLALNIATTRQILLHANAGKIIDTFGNMVVSGNFIVGAVVFLIITIVQFLVIAKGSERVAEVGARFTLDAMPGKQMSIDADLRAGSIDMDTAKIRRTMVEKESQLYGAMDGAMKFVKGDAIAGIVVTVVNILGGIAIGVLQREMSTVEALQTYAILTIGDGLVSQIPALFISITAGIIVTRVSVDNTPHLGGDIGNQVLAHPKALLIGSTVLLGFMLVPGFPKLPFLALALFTGSLGYLLWRQKRSIAEETIQNTADDHENRPLFPLPVPILLAVPEHLQTILDINDMNRRFAAIRQSLFQDLGVPVPPISVHFTPSLDQHVYEVQVFELPVAAGDWLPDHLLVREATEHLDIAGISYQRHKSLSGDPYNVWVPEHEVEALERLGVEGLGLAEMLAHHLDVALRRHAEEFLGLQQTQKLLDQINPECELLIKEVQRVLPLPKVAEVLRRLVREEISIRHIQAILESLVEWGPKEKDEVLLTEYARMNLKRYISYKFADDQHTLASFLFDPELEEMVRKSIRQTTGGSFLALPASQTKQLIAAIRRQLGLLAKATKRPVLLLSMDIRRHVKQLLHTDISDLPVLSYQELISEIQIQPIGKIKLETSPHRT